ELIVADGAQRSYASQVQPWARECAGTRSLSQQQARKGNALPTCQFDRVLIHRKADDVLVVESNALILVEGGGARPELVLSHTAAKVVLECWAVVDRVGVIRNDSNVSC